MLCILLLIILIKDFRKETTLEYSKYMRLKNQNKKQNLSIFCTKKKENRIIGIIN